MGECGRVLSHPGDHLQIQERIPKHERLPLTKVLDVVHPVVLGGGHTRPHRLRAAREGVAGRAGWSSSIQVAWALVHADTNVFSLLWHLLAHEIAGSIVLFPPWLCASHRPLGQPRTHVPGGQGAVFSGLGQVTQVLGRGEGSRDLRGQRVHPLRQGEPQQRGDIARYRPHTLSTVCTPLLIESTTYRPRGLNLAQNGLDKATLGHDAHSRVSLAQTRQCHETGGHALLAPVFALE